MKFLAPLFPVMICLAMIGSLAIFVAGTFIFLAAQAFYEIHANSGALAAYLVVIAGVMVFSCIAYQIVKCGLLRVSNKKKSLIKTGIDLFGPTAKLLVSVLVYEGMKLYLSRKEKDKEKK